ncbi:class I SAM-dependent methyltransferase [Arthrobacter sp. NEB 688]|uniref:class I SAM-dependent methyltransferase n=1 Tax=Arthrobacter sp. NEB 688 TaxID=904039 RepID=UPI001563FEE9|nr:class I SAM-dependent methyltransferase [Arthrobacter sp. NEB 688]QKE83681.1 class I SAM-dependent methyltransferase [Arthrobacter sp. NEB 688]
MSGSSGALRSPNIWDTPEVYELENLASDRAGVIDGALDGLHPLRGATLVDVGCGTGFHLPRFAERGATVLGVEPHLPLVRRAANRLRARGSRARVVAASAEALPLPDASVDVVHARWAYFFGAGCEPGLAEVERVLRPGGVACLVDNDATRSTFGGWFSRAYPAYDPVAVQRFWDRQGFTTERLTIDWRFERREDLEAVVRIELPPGPADAVLAEHEGLTVDYAVALRWRHA